MAATPCRYLSEFLLEKGYEVHGILRRCSTFNTERVDHIFDSRYTPCMFVQRKLMESWCVSIPAATQWGVRGQRRRVYGIGTL